MAIGHSNITRVSRYFSEFKVSDVLVPSKIPVYSKFKGKNLYVPLLSKDNSDYNTSIVERTDAECFQTVYTWKTDTSLIDARSTHTATGSVTSILIQGGSNVSNQFHYRCDIYNGNVWKSDSNNIVTPRYNHTATGTSTNCMIQGGAGSGVSNEATLFYNGNTWNKEYSMMNIGRQDHSASGTATVCMIQGGKITDNSTTDSCEVYNGASWYMIPALNKLTKSNSAVGGITSATVIGGTDGAVEAAYYNTIEVYNGYSWSTPTIYMSSKKVNHTTSGVINNFMTQGGFYSNVSEIFNGYYFVADSSCLGKREYHSSTSNGNSTTAMIQGGNLNGTKTPTTEIYSANSFLKTRNTNKYYLGYDGSYTNNNEKSAIGFINSDIKFTSRTTKNINEESINPLSMVGLDVLSNGIEFYAVGGTSNSGITVSNSSMIFNDVTGKIIPSTLYAQNAKNVGKGTENNFLHCGFMHVFELYNGDNWSAVNSVNMYPNFIFGTPTSAIHDSTINNANNRFYFNGYYSYLINGNTDNINSKIKAAGSSNNGAIIKDSRTLEVYNGYVFATGKVFSTTNAATKITSMIKINDKYELIDDANIISQYDLVSNNFITRNNLLPGVFDRDGDSSNNRDGFYMDSARIIKFINPALKAKYESNDKTIYLGSLTPDFTDWYTTTIDLNKLDSRTAIIYENIDYVNSTDNTLVKGPFERKFNVDVNYTGSGIWETSLNYPIVVSSLASVGNANSCISICGNSGNGYYNNCYLNSSDTKNIWTAAQNYIASVMDLAACGANARSVLAYGGFNGSTYSDLSSKYGGSTWSVAEKAPIGLSRHSMIGTPNLATSFGGYSGASKNTIMQYNGVWSTLSKTISSNYYLNSSGRASYVLLVGGYSNSNTTIFDANTTTTSSYLLQKRYAFNQTGNVNNTIISGGEIANEGPGKSSSTHAFNGSVWKILDSMMSIPKAYSGHTNSGSTGYMMSIAGNTIGNINSVEIFTREISNTPAVVTLNTPAREITSYDDIYTTIAFTPNIPIASWVISANIPIAVYAGSMIGNSPNGNKLLMYSKNKNDAYYTTIFKNIPGYLWETSSMTQIDSDANGGGVGSIYNGIHIGGWVNSKITRKISNEIMSKGVDYPAQARFLSVVGRPNALFSAYGYDTKSKLTTFGFDGTTWRALSNSIVANDSAVCVGNSGMNISTGGTRGAESFIYNSNTWISMVNAPIQINRGSSLGTRYSNATFQTGFSNGQRSKIYLTAATIKYNGHVFSIANNMNVARNESMASGNLCVGGSTNTGSVDVVASTEAFINGDLLDQVTGNMIDYHGKNVVEIKTTKASKLPELKLDPHNGTWVNKGVILPVDRQYAGVAGTPKSYITFNAGTSTIYNSNNMITGPNVIDNRTNILNSTVGNINNLLTICGTSGTTNISTSIKYNGISWTNGINFPIAQSRIPITGNTNSCVSAGTGRGNGTASYTFNGSNWSSVGGGMKLTILGSSTANKTVSGRYFNAISIALTAGQESYNGNAWSVTRAEVLYAAPTSYDTISSTGSSDSMIVSANYNSLLYDSNTISINGYSTTTLNAGAFVGYSTNCSCIGYSTSTKSVQEFLASTSFYENGPKTLTSIGQKLNIINGNENNITPEISYDISSKHLPNYIIAQSLASTSLYGGDYNTLLNIKYTPNMKTIYTKYNNLEYYISKVKIIDSRPTITKINDTLVEYNKILLNLLNFTNKNNTLKATLDVISSDGEQLNLESKEIGFKLSSAGTRRDFPLANEFIENISIDKRNMRYGLIGVWTTNTSTLNESRNSHSVTGTSTNCMMQGGYNNGSGTLNNTESYNGSIWTTNSSTLNTGRYSHSATGTATNCMVHGASSNIINNTESYNGNIWTTNSSTLNNGRNSHSATGTSTNCMVQGGLDSARGRYLNNTESYNGSVWTTNSNTLNTLKGAHSVTGTSTNCMVQGGYANGTSRINTTESYNGSVWTTNSSKLNTARSWHTATGTITNCMIQGGRTANTSASGLNTTESYNGNVWVSNNTTLNTIRDCSTATGTSTSCMVQGGNDAGRLLNTTESYLEIISL